MITTIVLSVLIPTGVLTVAGAVRVSGSAVRTDVRGVALQTVIVIVVLLAIAGAVAGVLLSRGGEAVAEAERQDILIDAADITDDGLCESYGFTWGAAAGSCYRTIPGAPAPNTYNTESRCNDATHPQTGADLGYTWNADPAGDGSTPARCELP